jgi:imidazolonepropionase-like amidohydrolase
VEAGLTPFQALATGTVHVARFLGWEDSGTIAVGKRADLVLLDGNPLQDIGNTQRIAGVMIGGRWLDRSRIAELLRALERSD